MSDRQLEDTMDNLVNEGYLEVSDNDLDVYESHEEVLVNASAAIKDLLNDLRIHGIYGVVSLGVYDVLNDADLYDVNWSGSTLACKGIAYHTVHKINEHMQMSTNVMIEGDDGFEEIEA